METTIASLVFVAVLACMVVASIWAIRGSKRRAEIACPNCRYEGQPAAASGGLQFLTVLAFAALGLIFTPLLLISVLLFFVFLFSPSRPRCPQCHWKYTAPLRQQGAL